MRVLWFSVSPSLYSANGTNQGLGWIASLEHIVRRCKDIELGVAFEHRDNIFKVEQDGVVYYPMNVFKSTKDIRRREYHVDVEEKLFIPRCLEIIANFKPDIIHVFGSEWCYGLVQEHTSTPVVIHMQGCMPPYENAMFPPGYSWQEEHDAIPFWNIPWRVKHTLWKRKNMERVLREERILKGCKFFMGRTDWDYAITKIYSPNSLYFKCWEALRQTFVHSPVAWKPHENKRKMILLSPGPSPLKGMDVVLKTAKCLKDICGVHFEWRIYGASSKQLDRHQQKWGINPAEYNIKCLGVLDEKHLCEELIDCDIYIHLAYIDNSPNAICEAMCLGTPVIATYTGGIPSLVENEKTGILVPMNDPWFTAYQILKLYNDKQKMLDISSHARSVAVRRHSDEQILNSLLDIYAQIVSKYS